MLYRLTPIGTEVCLIATGGRTRWQLPKGHPEENEADRDAAKREVREETGCNGEIRDDLGDIAYYFFAARDDKPIRVRKSVRFYLLEYTSGNTDDHDGEVDDAAWWPLTEAGSKLTFPTERVVLQRAVERLTVRDR